ncbi:hypothetical protein TRVL_03977 [Trypanosoma vivax]|uniref:carnosine N-methyltransferase n=1 Tax=Trypanosoma vivax (strain Y486) TaxID=1055687 RepID=G0TUL4_TRYVY|nr:hypothetical protein TRVL_03977 [Trypanosoma vivax]CCC47649.1 conserved hypothetical protein [Trypanosoma vivax Y486]
MPTEERQNSGPPPPYPLGALPQPPPLNTVDSSDTPSSTTTSDENDMREDHISFMRTVKAFRSYRKHAMLVRETRLRNFKKFHKQYQRALCIDVDAMFVRYQDCIEANSSFLETICSTSDELFYTYWPNGTSVRQDEVPPPTPLDVDKVFSTLRQFVRDWSVEGAEERNSVYVPILNTLEGYFPDRLGRANVKVLVPGAGLCRLTLELALRGFAAQANEFSYHMLIAGHYVQNHVLSSGQHVVYPYVDNTCNLVNREDQFAQVLVPDLCASEAVVELSDVQQLPFGELSMVAGDFTEVYAKPEQQRSWNAVVTCFFIDTAHNIVEYMHILYNLLVPGGLWVNCGPLLYHFADSADDVSIELSLGEVLMVAQRFGFVILEAPKFIDTTYTSNHRSMKRLVYRCAFFVLQRPLEDGDSAKQLCVHGDGWAGAKNPACFKFALDEGGDDRMEGAK